MESEAFSEAATTKSRLADCAPLHLARTDKIRHGGSTIHYPKANPKTCNEHGPSIKSAISLEVCV